MTKLPEKLINNSDSRCIDKVNEILDYLAEREKFYGETPLFKTEGACGLNHCDHPNCHTITPTPLFKAESVQLNRDDAGNWHLGFNTKAEAEQALLKLTE